MATYSITTEYSQSEFDDLVAAVFWDSEHPLNEKLRLNFGHDKGTGVLMYSCSMADLRRDLMKLCEVKNGG